MNAMPSPETSAQRPLAQPAGRPLACFGVVGTDESRVYYVDPSQNVQEFAWNTGWVPTNLSQKLGVTAAPGSALACFDVYDDSAVQNTGATVQGNVYYINQDNQVNQLALGSGGWVDNPLPGNTAPGSALACFGVQGTKGRVYYFDENNQVNELAYENGWSNNRLPGGIPSGRSSPLACFGVRKQDSRVYYVDEYNQVSELAWNGGGWTNAELPGSVAAPGSALACFGVQGTDSRVYYFDENNQVNELAWNGSGWSNGELPGYAAPGSALACFGVQGTDSRVYYFDENNQVNELAWNDSGWSNGKLLAYAAPGSPLACFGAGGTATVGWSDGGTDSRVYYLNSDGRVVELAWRNGGWQMTLT
jgi:hypothetical protein